MSADCVPPGSVPEALRRLIGQHPAALRTVSWQDQPLAQDEAGHLEIETKHGQVVLIERPSGAVFANPPIPPDCRAPRQQRDLTESIAGAFDGRPVIEQVEPVVADTLLVGWRFWLSTGRAFTMNLDTRKPLTTTTTR